MDTEDVRSLWPFNGCSTHSHSVDKRNTIPRDFQRRSGCLYKKNSTEKSVIEKQFRWSGSLDKISFRFIIYITIYLLLPKFYALYIKSSMRTTYILPILKMNCQTVKYCDFIYVNIHFYIYGTFHAKLTT